MRYRDASLPANYCNEVLKALTFQKEDLGCKKVTHLGNKSQLQLKSPLGDSYSHTAKVESTPKKKQSIFFKIIQIIPSKFKTIPSHLGKNLIKRRSA